MLDTSAPTNQNRTEPDCFFMSETVPVLVIEKTFHVHKSILTERSKFFQRAVKPEWRTDPSAPISLSQLDPVVFAAYCQWLYFNKLPQLDPASPDFYYDDLINLYLLGEVLVDDTVRRAVLETMINYCKSSNMIPGLSSVMAIYDGTMSGSPARRLMVDFWAFNMTSEWEVASLLTQDNKPFLEDLFPALLKYRGVPRQSVARPWVAHPESYEVHGDEVHDAANSG